MATYKCDRPSAENACECMMKLVQDNQQSRQYVFTDMVLVLSEYGIYMNTTDSMAKIYLLQSLQTTLQTSDAQTAQILKDE
jgi:hypothetical protein